MIIFEALLRLNVRAEASALQQMVGAFRLFKVG